MPGKVRSNQAISGGGERFQDEAELVRRLRESMNKKENSLTFTCRLGFEIMYTQIFRKDRLSAGNSDLRRHHVKQSTRL